MLLCIYCEKNSFDVGKGSEEHAILSSLGGRKASRNVCCQSCNNRLGDEIDKPFAEEYAYFSTMLDITTGRNKGAPTHNGAVENAGLAFDLKPGGGFKLSKSAVSLADRPDGTSSIAITAGSEQQALSLIESVLKRYGKSIDDFQSLEATSVRSYLPTQLKRLSLGGSAQFRAVAKMLLTYLATQVNPERLRGGAFDQVIAYIDGRNDEFAGISLGSRVLLPEISKHSDVDHQAIIITSQEKKLAIGVLELFGNIRYTIELSSAWDGPDIAKVYSIDPVEKISDERELKIDLSSALAGYDSYVPETTSIVAGVEAIVRTFQERQSNQRIASIAEAAVERHMVGKGDVVTKEMIGNVSSEVAREFVRFLQRIDSEETVDLKKKI
jgi:hypothetical protein